MTAPGRAQTDQLVAALARRPGETVFVDVARHATVTDTMPDLDEGAAPVLSDWALLAGGFATFVFLAKRRLGD